MYVFLKRAKTAIKNVQRLKPNIHGDKPWFPHYVAWFT